MSSEPQLLSTPGPATTTVSAPVGPPATAPKGSPIWWSRTSRVGFPTADGVVRRCGLCYRVSRPARSASSASPAPARRRPHGHHGPARPAQHPAMTGSITVSLHRRGDVDTEIRKLRGKTPR